MLAAAGSIAPPPAGGYADPASSLEVDKYAMKVAMGEVQQWFASLEVTQMPHNNPGFDIRVGSITDPTRYVEVKGTSTSDPLFFMSEGERDFSVRNAPLYSLLIVVGVNWKLQTHTSTRRHDGSVDNQVAALKCVQWRGRLNDK